MNAATATVTGTVTTATDIVSLIIRTTTRKQTMLMSKITRTKIQR
jgi:hypothetical protein